MVTGAELLDGIVGTLVRSVSVSWVETTATVVLPVTEPDVAVIVIVDPAVTPAPDSVAVMVPAELVVPVEPDMVPALAVSVMATPLRATLLELFASTVIVAVLLPSAGIDVTLLVTAKVDAVEVVVVVLVPVPVVPAPVVVPVPVSLDVQVSPVPVDVVVVVPLVRVLQPLLPPQPANARVAASRTIIEASVRMFLLPESRLGVDAIPHRINTH
jgi:hypothetical protein